MAVKFNSTESAGCLFPNFYHSVGQTLPQSGTHEILKECPGKWFFISYICSVQQLHCIRNIKSSWNTKLQDLQDIVYFSLQLNQSSTCQLCCQLLCSLQYSSAQAVAEGGFRQQLQPGLKEEGGDFSQLIDTPPCFLTARIGSDSRNCYIEAKELLRQNKQLGVFSRQLQLSI